jgi:nickel-type superoxide dismutase maturation protease
MNWRRAAVLALSAVPAALAAAVALSVRVEVGGDSMRPSLEPGDRLLAVRGRRVRPGQVVVVRDPAVRDPAVRRPPGRLLVKRVVATDGETVTVHGDNAAHSTDSRHTGPLPRSAVRGRVVYRYAPAARAGRL